MSSQLNSWMRASGATPHDLRRFFNQALEKLGAPQYVIDDLMGHAPGKVRAAYSRQDNPEQCRKWVEKFGQWLDGDQSQHH